MIKLIKKALKSNALGRRVYPALHKVYRLYSVPARRKRLQRSGYDVLKTIFEISEKEALGLFPVYGSLLGFIRDKGFIKWDDDIDLGFVAEEGKKSKIIKTLFAYGFEFYSGQKYHGELVEFTLKYKKITIDFFPLQKGEDSLLAQAFYWKEDVAYDSAKANSTYYMRHPLISTLEPFIIHNVKVMIPQNWEDVLIAEFGEKWAVPDPNFNEMNLPSFVNLDDFGYAVDESEFWSLLQ